MHLIPILSLLVATASLIHATPALIRSPQQPQESCEKPNEFRCHGHMIEKCGEDLVWKFTANCPLPSECVENKGYAFCGLTSTATPTTTTSCVTPTLEPTLPTQEPCTVPYETRCGGQFTNTVQQCIDNTWHFVQECASDEVCSTYGDRAQCNWLKARDSSLTEKADARNPDKRDPQFSSLDFCAVAYATRCYNNNIEYCEPRDFRWHHQSLCWTHDHQRCAQYLNRAVCENWGKRQDSLSIEGQQALHSEKQDKTKQNKRHLRKVAKRELCGVFYATRCDIDRIEYCEPWDRQWHHQSDCKRSERKICQQHFNRAVCLSPVLANDASPSPSPAQHEEKKREETTELTCGEEKTCALGTYACDKDRRFVFTCGQDGQWGKPNQCYKDGACEVEKLGKRDRLHCGGFAEYPYADKRVCAGRCEIMDYLLCLGTGGDATTVQSCLSGMCRKEECRECDRCQYVRPKEGIVPDLSTVYPVKTLEQ